MKLAACARRRGPTRRAFVPGVALLFLVLAAGCAHRPVPVGHPAPSARAPAPAPTTPPAMPPVAPGTWAQQGVASWYGVPFDGHRAADGEIYDMYQMTAAHRTLPFNSVVRVTNLKNGRQAEVRITDRGPFVAGRVIDLSFAAARALDMVGTGIAPVRLELVAGTNPDVGQFTVQVGAFTVETNAQRLRRRLAEQYPAVFIQQYDSPEGIFYRVRVGRVGSIAGARTLARELARQENVQPFVVRLDPQ